MPPSTPPPDRHIARWLSRIPDVLAAALLSAIAWWAWSTNDRLARVETKIEAIADHVGVDEPERHARR